jgi:signal transduction histidine kinase
MGIGSRTLVGKKGEAEPLAKDAIGASESQTAYEMLSRLNVAQQRRDERKSKLRPALPSRARSSSRYFDEATRGQRSEEAELFALEEAAPTELAASEFRDADVADSSAAQLQGLGYAAGSLDRELRADVPASAPQRLAAAPRPPPAASRPSEPVVDPLIGRTTPDGELVLVRSVWRNGGAERQGVVLDRDSLAQWLERRVLEDTGLEDQARVDFGAPGLPEREAAEHRYVHRFAEPFDALVARLDLEPLPGLGGSRPIYMLAGLLVAVAVVGLFAVQRGARVVVDYAQRRSDFVASVSHELKTPLTAIRMYGEMLRDGLVTGERKRDEYYATIADESERLSRLIDNVLEFSRLEQDQRPLELVVGSLEAALRDAAEKLRAHVEREGFALRLELDEALPCVRYDRDAVTQVVFNLVDNALKYARSTDRRDIVLALRGRERGVELCVRDYGPGIPSRKLRRVFEPFYRGGDELTRTAKGTGIGLALVRELAEAMGASVRGSNPPGGGFEVAVAFPAQA